jgi:hypothetical protein
MKTSGADGDADLRRRLDHELAIVHSAIALVASGASTRVTCGGLTFGTQLLADAQATGERVHVRVTPIWAADEDIVDLDVERDDRV